MTTCGGRRRPARAVVVAVVTAAVGAVSHGAEAFQLKHTSHGQPLHWAESNVSYVVDPSVEKAVPGGLQAVSDAVRGWTGVSGGPTLSTAASRDAVKPGLDGQNSVLLAPDGFAPAGRALAVTVTSYEDATGTIVDADIVINGEYPFGVLLAGAKPGRGATPVSTDGSPTDDHGSDRSPFDLLHVVSHEVGHSLGLADERDDESALMYAFTMPGDPSVRVPSADDVSGVDALYGPPGAAPPASANRGGCQASVAGSPARPGDAWGAFALLGGAGVWWASRRGPRASRAVVPLGAAFLALVANPLPAQSAPRAPSVLANVAARVLSVSTSNVGGMFESTVELAPMSCDRLPCPARARAQAWGGTLGGITQRIGGQDEVPRVGDIVGVALLSGEIVGPPGASGASEEANGARVTAVLMALGQRH